MLKDVFRDYVKACDEKSSSGRYEVVPDIYLRIEASKSLVPLYRRFAGMGEMERVRESLDMINDFHHDDECASIGTEEQYAAFIEAAYNIMNWRNNNMLGFKDDYKEHRSLIQRNNERIKNNKKIIDDPGNYLPSQEPS